MKGILAVIIIYRQFFLKKKVKAIFVKIQEAHSTLCLIFPKTLPIWNNVIDTAEGNKP